MDRYCPECNSTMTPSLVGHLCINCGHTQRFYSPQESSMTLPTTEVGPSVASSTKSEPKHTNKPKKRHTKPNNKIKSTLKRLMVPEIAPPHPHLIGDGDNNIKPVMADKIDAEQNLPALAATKPTSNADQINNDYNPVKNSPSKNTSIDDTNAVPNQSSNLSDLESALHPQKNTSVWVMLGLAMLMLLLAAAVLFMIILS